MAICRACACYMSHKTVGLAKPCKHTSHGRQARLRRFMSGRHPEPGFKEFYIENVVHLRSGEFNLFRSGTARGSGEPPIEDAIQQFDEDWNSAAPSDPALMEAEPQPCVEHGVEEDYELLGDDEGMGLPAYY